jgi:hypothetical protein
MTLFQWLSARWQTQTVDRAPAIAVAPKSHSRPRVPAEYQLLHKYLDDRYAATVVLTFEQIEALQGRALPAIARTDAAWWTAAPLVAMRHSDAWTVANRSAVPNLPALTVTFERRG